MLDSQSLGWSRTAFAVVLALTAAVGSACGTRSGGQTGADLDKYFRRDVATAQAAGLEVYWLGQEFTADGLVFSGSYGAEFGAEVPGGIQLTYLAPSRAGGSSHTRLDLIVRTRDAWAQAEARIREPGVPGVSRRMVAVQGREAELISIPLGTRPLNTLWLVLDVEDAVVVGQTLAGGRAYPGGPDYNPFINNPDVLVQVIEENLRPYPE